MSTYTITDPDTGASTWVDTAEEVPSAELFTFCDERAGGGLDWMQVALVEGATESLIAGEVGLANLDLAALGLRATRDEED